MSNNCVLCFLRVVEANYANYVNHANAAKYATSATSANTKKSVIINRNFEFARFFSLLKNCVVCVICVLYHLPWLITRFLNNLEMYVCFAGEVVFLGNCLNRVIVIINHPLLPATLKTHWLKMTHTLLASSLLYVISNDSTATSEAPQKTQNLILESRFSTERWFPA